MIVRDIVVASCPHRRTSANSESLDTVLRAANTSALALPQLVTPSTISVFCSSSQHVEPRLYQDFKLRLFVEEFSNFFIIVLIVLLRMIL